MVEARGWGMRDPEPLNGLIKVNGKIKVDLSNGKESIRGLNVLLLRQNPTGVDCCEVIPDSYRNFDTHRARDQATSFKNYVQEQDDGTVVIVATADEPTGYDTGDIHYFVK